jgi:hypothetical protein
MRAPLCAVLTVIALLPGRVPAARETAITIGPGWAAVQEQMSVSLTGLEQNVSFPDVPAEADLSSLAVWSPRAPVRLMSWAREHEAGADRIPDAADGTLTWNPAQPAGTRGGDGPLVCRIRAEATGPRTLSLSYLMTGISWRVSYSVLVRGDIAGEQERLAVDLDGVLLVRNTSGRTYDGVALNLVGPDPQARASPAPAPGFLLLEDHPLADLWSKQSEPVVPMFVYPIRPRVRLAARSEIQVALTSSSRQPAERVYVLRSGDVPTAAGDPPRPLRRVMVLENAPRPGGGMGDALPAGSAKVFLGVMRSTLSQEAWFAHTPASGVFRIDLGPADKVLGSRRFIGRQTLSAGEHEDTYSVTVENRLSNSVAIEVEEMSGLALGWELVRSTAAYRVQAGAIVFTADVPAEGRTEIRYTLRHREPSL